jgi:hypothetical protein
MEAAEAAFLEYLLRKEMNPDLTLDEFCGQDSEVSGLVRNMASLWRLLEAESTGRARSGSSEVRPGNGGGPVPLLSGAFWRTLPDLEDPSAIGFSTASPRAG